MRRKKKCNTGAELQVSKTRLLVIEEPQVVLRPHAIWLQKA